MTIATQFTQYLERCGATYVKFGQALSSRPDIVPRSLAIALSKLQDDMDILDNTSIGVVYSGILPSSLSSSIVTGGGGGGGSSRMKGKGKPQKVAIKIQRPNVISTVEKDAKLLKANGRGGGGRKGGNKFIQTNVTGAVDEFMSRLHEELDYYNEADNLELFSKLYSHRRPSQPKKEKSKRGQVYRNLCTDKVLVMEWIDGIKLVDLQRNQRKQEQLTQGIDCTLSQLLETGILHADPHGGNLLKVQDESSKNSNDSYRLGYIDFGMLSTIPTKVQDGLICAVCQLIFAKNVTAVGELFNELMLLPKEVLNDPDEALALGIELEYALSSILVYNEDDANNDGLIIPTLRFDKLLDVLTRLVPRFQFQLPPYFLNNARALATLEGMAREVNPKFNILHNLYPYAISRLFSNPTSSEVVDKCLKSLIENPLNEKLDIYKLQNLLEDASYYSGYKKRKVINDIMKSKNGFSLVRRLIREQTYGRLLMSLSSSRRDEKKKVRNEKQNSKRKRKDKEKMERYTSSSSSSSSSLMRPTRQRRLRLRLPFLDRVADSFRL
ncbi:hypothetical protein FRACYDRAFT_182087 [Fragilariopsis cylindrus CCMP1102]|uniref:ABC1 atypical kinase-like domain-containing protein n=1 Tax=Fragilariopsis cylindrus CCMP1102 TaxID=635003 RepID=A0A1E7FNW4_9STRA|nr:hypothetical protein FRACYDRAFT_182087 [Fragilariopsis cylindrus CCMP1102]|eukprot:OEU19483.1 hypothetical protein FRACYDRAFT_182087 [Fragilariopsis cylindrus CCMP1102]